MTLKFQNATSRTSKNILKGKLTNLILCCQILLANFVLLYDPGQAEDVFQQKVDGSSVGMEKSLWIMLGVLLKPSYY